MEQPGLSPDRVTKLKADFKTEREAAAPEIRQSVADHAAAVPVAQQGTPRSAKRDASQAGHLEVGVVVFLVLAAMLLFVWLAIRGPALLERISGWRPICFDVSCETHAQTQTQPQTSTLPQSSLSLSRRLNPLGIRHGRARMYPIRLSWVNVYRQDIGVTTHGGFMIRSGAGQSSAGAIAEVRASISFRRAASIRASTSPGVRCSRVRSSAFGRGIGATVRKISVGATRSSAEFVNEITLAREATVRTSHKVRTVSKR